MISCIHILTPYVPLGLPPVLARCGMQLPVALVADIGARPPCSEFAQSPPLGDWTLPDPAPTLLCVAEQVLLRCGEDVLTAFLAALWNSEVRYSSSEGCSPPSPPSLAPPVSELPRRALCVHIRVRMSCCCVKHRRVYLCATGMCVLV